MYETAERCTTEADRNQAVTHTQRMCEKDIPLESHLGERPSSYFYSHPFPFFSCLHLHIDILLRYWMHALAGFISLPTPTYLICIYRFGVLSDGNKQHLPARKLPRHCHDRKSLFVSRSSRKMQQATLPVTFTGLSIT